MLDVEALRREFRAKAKARGIDPERGANAFQVALVKAEQAARERKRLDFFRYQQLMHGESPDGRGEVEREAFARIEAQARRVVKPIIPPVAVGDLFVDLPLLRDLWGEVRREMAHEASLRELHILRGIDLAAPEGT